MLISLTRTLQHRIALDVSPRDQAGTNDAVAVVQAVPLRTVSRRSFLTRPAPVRLLPNPPLPRQRLSLPHARDIVLEQMPHAVRIVMDERASLR